MRRALTVMGAVLLLGLPTACGGDSSVEPPDGPSRSTSGAAQSPFAQAASRISPDALDKQHIVEFGQTSELLALSKTDQRWESVTPMGNLLAANEPWAESIGVAAEAADYSIEAGVFPTRVGVVAGGQDADAITEAAEQSGYTGDDVLTQDLSPAAPVTISIQQIKPLEQDVVLATVDADVGWVDGGSLFADQVVGSVVACLGDVLAAMVTEHDDAVVGVGVRADDGDIVSVICVPGGDDAVEDAEKDLGGPDFVDRLELVGSEVVEDLARITVRHVADVPAGLLFSALAKQDLPGG